MVPAGSARQMLLALDTTLMGIQGLREDKVVAVAALEVPTREALPAVLVAVAAPVKTQAAREDLGAAVPTLLPALLEVEAPAVALAAAVVAPQAAQAL